MFSILAVALFVIGGGLLIAVLFAFSDQEIVLAAILGVLGIMALIGAYFFQTHRVVSTQYTGVSRATFSQRLYGPYGSGIISKPFFGDVWEYPAAQNYERCEKFTPALKGSYGIVVDVCFYFDTSRINWKQEIEATGSLDANFIMSTWRNSIVDDIARPFKEYTPEALSDNRTAVEQDMFEQVNSWFAQRKIPLVRLSFKNWEFSSASVAEAFDTSIISQRKITEQAAEFETAKIRRERELYEAETARQVAEEQHKAIQSLGITEQDAIVQYLWIKLLLEQQKTPDTVIIGNSPIAVPIK